MHESIVFKHCLPDKKNSCQVVNFQHAYRYIVSVMTRLASPGGVLPYMGYIGMCRGIGYDFRGARSLNTVSFLTLLILCSWCGPLIG